MKTTLTREQALQLMDSEMYMSIYAIATKYGFGGSLFKLVNDNYIPMNAYSHKLDSLHEALRHCQAVYMTPIDDAHYSISKMNHEIAKRLIKYIQEKINVLTH